MNNSSLRIRLTGMVGIAALLLLGSALFLAFFFPARMDAVASRWSVSRAEAVAQTLDPTLSAALDSGDAAAVRIALSGLHTVADAAYGQVRRADNSVLGGWNTAAANGFLTDQALEAGTTVDAGQLHLVHPLVSQHGKAGVLVMGFSLAELEAARRHNRIIGAALAAFIVGLGVALSYITAMTLVRPMTQLALLTNDIVKTGDLTRTVDVLRSDELGLLAKSVRDIVQQQRSMLGRINGLINGVSEVVKRVSSAGINVTAGAMDIQKRVEQTSRAAQDMQIHLQASAQDVQALERNAEMSHTSLENMAANNIDVVQSVGNMANSSQQTGVAIEQMAASVSEIAQSIESLNAAVGETSSSMQRMDAAIEQVERSSKETARISERVLSDAETGVDALQKTMQGIDNIKHSSQSAAHVISNLGIRISEIGAILRVIDEVAAQTKLLSLNAAIIASQAGEHGRGFSVVADQIKELAQRTGASTREISTLIQGIQEESRNATAAMDLGVSSVEMGVRLGNEASEALLKIRESANDSTMMFKKIAQATVDQARNSKQMTAAIERIAHTVTQISNYSAEQASGADQIITSSKHMGALTEKVRRSSEEQARGSKQVVQVIESINGMVSRLAASQKYQTHGADLVQNAVEEISTISKGQTVALSELDNAISSLGSEARTLEAEISKYKL